MRGRSFVVTSVAAGLLGLLLAAAVSGGGGAEASVRATAGVSAATSAPARSASVAVFGRRTMTSGCHVRRLLPDRRCTPGAILTQATVGRICTPGYSRSVRNVPESLKRAVYDEYGIASHVPGSYEVDHLVPLELGGSNSISNLWPEASPGFRAKDRVENRLHDAVCAGLAGLGEAQRQIAHDWRHTYVGTSP